MARVPPLFLDGVPDQDHGADSSREDSVDQQATQAPTSADPRDRYPVEGKLGTSTYLVKDVTSRNEFKVLRRLDFKPSEKKERKEIFLKFRKVQRESFHQNLLRIYDVFQAESSVYVITEYCEGGTLQGVINRARKQDEMLNEIEVLDWVVEILRALQHIHDLEGVHGNLSPPNILLKNNSIRLNCTLELNRISSLEKESKRELSDKEGLHLVELTDEDELCEDSNLYDNASAEEQHRNTPSPKLDVWAAGTLIYEMCCKQKMRENHYKELPDFYPHQLNLVWQRMIDNDPERRPSAFELLEDPFLLEHAQEMDLPVFTFREETREPKLQNVFDLCDDNRIESPEVEDESWLERLISESPSPD